MGEIFEKPAADVPLAWTGERLTSGAGPQVEIEHLHRYFFARALCRNLDVLDVASGEGYGAALLAQTARAVIGVELDADAVAHSAATYAAPNLRFQQGDACALPLPDACVDIVVSFETIEHFYDHDKFLSEVRRVLRPGGRAIISSPERDVYSPDATTPNPHHVRELTRTEFLTTLRRYFGHIVLQGQRALLGSALVTESERIAGSTAMQFTFERRGNDRFEQSDGLPRPVYLVAIVSDAPLDGIPDSLYVYTSAIEEVLLELPLAREAIQKSQTALADAGNYANHVEAELAMRDRDLAELSAYTRDVEAKLAARDGELTEMGEHVRHTNDELAKLKLDVSRLRALTDAGFEADIKRTAMRAHIGHVEAEYRKASNALLAGAVYARDLEHKLNVLQTINVSLNARLRKVIGSTSWRLTQPLRLGLVRHPQVAKALRRISKLLWWTVTMRLPDRLAARRRGAAYQPPIPEIVVAPPQQIASPNKKDQFATGAKRELLDFLASGQRLIFPKIENPDISVLIILWNSAHFTLRCVRALLGQKGASIELILFDNASTDETSQLLDRIDGAVVLRNASNEGFLIGCNKAAAAARGRTVLLLNSDAFVRPNALAAALETLDAAPDVGAVGGKLILPSGLLQEAGSIVWSDGSSRGYARGLDPSASEAMFRRNVDYCSGAFLLTPKDLWEQLKGFDRCFLPAYYEEADYCMRLHDLGFRVVYEPQAIIDHFEFGSEAKSGEAGEIMLRNRERFHSRHLTELSQRYLPFSEANILNARTDPRFEQRRLLVMDNEVPLGVLGSGYPRMREILNEAAGLGWAVTFFPLHVTAVDWDTARSEISWDIEIADARGLAGLPKFLDERQGYYDVILISRPDNMRAVLEACWDRPHIFDGSRLVYDAEALFAAREISKAAVDGRPFDNPEGLIDAEISLAKGASAILCVTPSEAEMFRSRVTAPAYVLGHPTTIATNVPGFAQRSGFLFVGRLLERDAPNWQGLAWFLESCWPNIRREMPDVTLTVIGRLCPEHRELCGPGVRLLGSVDDVRPFYDAARIFLAPIRFAAGVPIKVLEATAAGLPTAGTSLMARQLAWTADIEMISEDEPFVLAAAIVELYGNEGKWNSMRAAAQARLSAEHSSSTFRTTLGAILDGPPSLLASGITRLRYRTADAAVHVTDNEDDAHRIHRVNETWGAENSVWSGPAKQWLSHPMVMERLNRLASGDPRVDAYGHLKASLIGMGWTLPVPKAASLCCGRGSLERALVMQGYAETVIGYDLAGEAIEEARRLAEAEGLADLVAYEVRDLEQFGLGKTGLDMVFAFSGLHHLSRLEETFDAVHAALRPGGVFHVHEYVGPDRFQWTDQQLHGINSFLKRLPEHYRRLPDGSLKQFVTRPTIQEMLDSDPSEAVRSSSIEPLLAERFDILERRELGGTLLHMALSNIAQNFDPDVEADRFWIMDLFSREDQLLKDGAIGSDFTVVTARRR